MHGGVSHCLIKYKQYKSLIIKEGLREISGKYHLIEQSNGRHYY